MKRQVKKGEWVLRQVDYVDETNRVVYFTASGFNKGEDPYNQHYCRINLDGTGFTDMTPENGNHRVTFSADRSYFTDVYSRPVRKSKAILFRHPDHTDSCYNNR